MEDRNPTQERSGIATLPALGGTEGIGRWVGRFYDLIAEHPLLSPMFGDLEASKAKQQAYFVEFFGGPKLYSERHGKPFLRFLHRHVKIGREERDAWMELAMESLREEMAQGLPGDPTHGEAVIAEVEMLLGDMADKMINHHPQKKDAYYFQH